MTGDTRFTLLASYNQWMNRSLYDTVATLPHEAIVSDRGAFFGSILGTLNHLVVTDTIPLSDVARLCPKIRQISVAEMLAETMRRIAFGESVSSMYVD